MNKFTKIVALLFVCAMICTPTVLFAAEGDAHTALDLTKIGAGIGAGIVMLGAAYGIGRIGSSAVESMARQPEKAGAIQTAMIIAAALIEGATFFALYICMK